MLENRSVHPDGGFVGQAQPELADLPDFASVRICSWIGAPVADWIATNGLAGGKPFVALDEPMVDFAVHPGAVEPYEHLAPVGPTDPLDPAFLSSPHRTAHYVRLARRAGRVLEYGAGMGTLSLAMARAGAQVVAVELSELLLAKLRAKVRLEPSAVARRLEILPGDLRSRRLRRTFPLVIAPAGVLQHLYNRRDVESFFEAVRRHLAPDGRFVFDLELPDPHELEGDYDPISQVLWRPLLERQGEAQHGTVALRQYFPRELQMLLDYLGFRDVRLRSEPAPRGTAPHLRAKGPTAKRQLMVVSARKGPSPRTRRATSDRK